MPKRIRRNRQRGKILLPILFLLITAASCSRRPSYVIDEDKMVQLMADMQLAEAYSSTVKYSSAQDRLDLGKGVLEAHGITREQLDTTLAWYGRNVDEYSLLFEKIDKEIDKRGEKLRKERGEEITINNMETDLWPYESHGMISGLGNNDGWIVSIPFPQLEKGDRLVWSFNILDAVTLNGVFGVEYTDGSAEATMTNMTKKNRIEISLQTDTAKTVERVYGSMTVKNRESLPLFADSIKILISPYDSLEYRRRRNQKSYLPAMVRKPVLPTDTVKPDSIQSASINAGISEPDSVASGSRGNK